MIVPVLIGLWLRADGVKADECRKTNSCVTYSDVQAFGPHDSLGCAARHLVSA